MTLTTRAKQLVLEDSCSQQFESVSSDSFIYSIYSENNIQVKAVPFNWNWGS